MTPDATSSSSNAAAQPSPDQGRSPPAPAKYNAQGPPTKALTRQLRRSVTHAATLRAPARHSKFEQIYDLAMARAYEFPQDLLTAQEELDQVADILKAPATAGPRKTRRRYSSFGPGSRS